MNLESKYVDLRVGFSIEALFAAARNNPANPMNRAGRLMGRHCQARLARAQAKRRKAGKTPYSPRG